jgi:hypothetical protein
VDNEESIRHTAVSDLERAIGPRSALYIMSKLPVVNWHELATKEDLKPLATKDDLRVLAAEIRSEMHQGFTEQTRWLVGFMTTFVGVWSAVLIGAAKLLF